MIRKLVGLTLVLLLSACSATVGRSAHRASAMAASPCLTDTAVLSFTMYRVESVLDAASDDTSLVTFRTQRGLSGATIDSVSVVNDPATCEKAKLAYIAIVYPEPSDSVQRRNFTEDFKEVLVVRLSASRYLLASNILDPLTLYEMFLVDGSFRLVRRGF